MAIFSPNKESSIAIQTFASRTGQASLLRLRSTSISAKDVVASAKDVTVSFNLLARRKACQDLVLTRTYISARVVRDQLRKYSEHDEVRILD